MSYNIFFLFSFNFAAFFFSYDVYSFSVIPAIGELVAGDRQSYQYLVESIRRFPNQVMVLWIISTFVCYLQTWTYDYILFGIFYFNHLRVYARLISTLQNRHSVFAGIDVKLEDGWMTYMLTRLVPLQEKFAQMIQEAGFQRVEYENLVGGVVAIHSGLKL